MESDSWISQLNTISEHSKTEVHAPLINLSKKEVVQLAKKLNVDLNRTISCYQPSNDMECGVCLSFLVKREAFVKIKSELKKEWI